MDILRLRCTSCGHTHAILPADIIPYCIYSVSAILSVCTAYLIENQPVLELASLNGLCYQVVYAMLRLLKLYLDRVCLLLRNLRLWAAAPNPSPAESIYLHTFGFFNTSTHSPDNCGSQPFFFQHFNSFYACSAGRADHIF